MPSGAVRAGLLEVPRPPETITPASVRDTPPSLGAIAFDFGLGFGDGVHLGDRAGCARVLFGLGEGASAQGDDLRFGVADGLFEQFARVDGSCSHNFVAVGFQGDDIHQHAGVQVDGGHAGQLAATSCGREQDQVRALGRCDCGQGGGVGLDAEVL